MAKATSKQTSNDSASSTHKRSPASRKSAGSSTHSYRSSTLHQAVCREASCESIATTNQYCRMHYIKNWQKIKLKETILNEGRLQRYIVELVDKYPDKYIEAIQEDLLSDKAFSRIIQEFEVQQPDEEFEEIEPSHSSDSFGSNSLTSDFDNDGDNF